MTLESGFVHVEVIPERLLQIQTKGRMLVTNGHEEETHVQHPERAHAIVETNHTT